MAYTDSFPSNQRTGPTPGTLAPASTTPAQPPLAKVQERLVNTQAIGAGFRKMGNDIVQQQLPSFIHRLLYGIVDALLPGSAPTPYIGRSNYAAFTGMMGARMPQMPQYGQRVGLNYPAAPVTETLTQKRAFDTFILDDKDLAREIFQGLIEDSMQLGYLTVSQVYDRLRVPCPSYMAVQYYWTSDELMAAEMTEMLNGEIRVKMPKAHLMGQ